MTTLFDQEGFLEDLSCWSETIALEIAQKEGIELSPAHFEIIQLARQYYQEFGLSPVNRILITYIRQNLGPKKGTSLYVMTLFPSPPAKTVCKIAGLPKPNNCL